MALEDIYWYMDDRIMSACQEKCIPNNYHEPDLNKGEQKCIDRCVGKYMSIQGILGEKMKHLAPGYASTANSDGFSPDRQQWFNITPKHVDTQLYYYQY